MFKKASKSQSKLRLAIFGTSGSGKTYSSLRIASGLGEKIAFIDTERGSACKYADRFAFDVAELEQKSIESYVKAIESAKGYDVLIIDSLSHAWQELIEEVDKVAKAKYKGNTWSAWSDGTPRQKKLINAILNYQGHIIATMRVKTEWILTETKDGKKKPEKVGLNPEQGKGIDYEFDLLMEIDNNHYASISKDRTGKFQDRIIDKPGEDLGKELKEWLNTGAPIPKKKENPYKELLSDLLDKISLSDSIEELKQKYTEAEEYFNGYEDEMKQIIRATNARKKVLEDTLKADDLAKEMGL